MKQGIGIIGCGSRMEGLLKSLLDLDKNVEVRALRDPDPKRIEKFRKEFNPNARVCGSARETAADENISWVAVASWNSLHAEQASVAFEQGKNVFCEKPLATNFEDCLKILEACKKSGKKLITGFTLRYSWQYRKIKEIIDSGLIGKIISFEFNETLNFNHGGHIMSCWRRNREFTGCHILEKCCHDIDLANWIVGSRVKKTASFGGLDIFKPENQNLKDNLSEDENGFKPYCSWPKARGKNPFTTDKDIIDNQVCIMEYENGARATFHTNLTAGIPERRMYILGTKGALRADLAEGKIEIRKIGFGEKSIFYEGEHKGGHGGADDVLVNHWSRMIHEEIPSLTGIETGIESAVACFAMDRAMRENKIVELDEYWEKLDIEKK